MHTSTHADVQAPVSYIERGGRKPFAYEYDPPAGTPRRSAAYREHLVRIRNARNLHAAPALDRQGFALREHPTQVGDFYDPAEVTGVYYAEIEQLVKEATGASRVMVFDHTVRGNSTSTRSGTQIEEPVSRVHNDYTAESAVRRARATVHARDAEQLLQHRIAEVNVWRPIRGPLQTRPLALLDATTLRPDDLVACDLIYRDRLGEIYYIAHHPRHEWYYYPHMRREEVLLLKGFDSDPSRTRFGPHASFSHPDTPTDALPRESIEVRTFAFFA
ncbi:MAG TPA: CmcJ/NvfI family oxidoreductase [Steroidobacteraceae bacterium]|nr:CmcJ/NvfI family oxidoreductase [Steroidobacteraceae bacterium]